MKTPPESLAADEVSLQIMLFLRSGQHFSVHGISRAIGQPMEEVWNRLLLLERFELVEVEGDGYKLTKEGSNFLLGRGYHIPKLTEVKKGKRESDGFKIHPFGSFEEFVYWILFPLIICGLLAPIFLEVWFQSMAKIWGITWLVIGIVLFLVYVVLSFRRVPEYENLVIFRLGKCIGKRGPGPILIIPFLDKPQNVDLRVKHQEVPHETCITQDNVQLDVDFVFYWKIQEPIWSITKVSDPDESIRLLATALLRAVIAHFKFNDVLNQRESINDLLKEKIDEISTEWGVYVTTMEIREIKPPKEIVDSMHKQVSAEWQSKATITQAEGDAAALQIFNDAATKMDEKTKSLKYYETLKGLGEGQATKYIFPVELINLAKGLTEKDSDEKSTVKEQIEKKDNKKLSDNKD